MAIDQVRSYAAGTIGRSIFGSEYYRLGPCNLYFGNREYENLDGTVDRDSVNLKKINGTNTLFLSQLQVGDYIIFDVNHIGAPFRVAKINSNTELILDQDAPNITNSNIYKVDLIFLGNTTETSLKFKLNKADLNASQEGNSPADRAVVGYELTVETSLTSATLERINRLIQGFDLKYDINGNIIGAYFGLPIGQMDSEIARELHLVRISGGVESQDLLDHIVIFRAVPQADAEAKYDAASQLVFKLSFYAYVDKFKKINGLPLIFAIGNVGF